jgi:Kef-type K+ transport system membrane component KefB
MLDHFILEYLTKKGKIAYYVGQVLLIAIWAYYLFGIVGYTIDEGETSLFIGLIIIVIVWAGVCLLFWKKSKDKSDNAQTSAKLDA